MKDQKSGGFLNNFFEFVADTEELSHEETLQALKDEGIDTEQTQCKINQIVKAGLEKRRLAWREKAQKKRSLFEKLLSKKETAANFKERMEEFLSIQGKKQLAETYFRKKDSLSEEDLGNLINDIEDLDLLKKFFEKEDKQHDL